MQRKESGKKAPVKNASKLKVGIVVSTYYEDITGRMLDGALETLRAWKVSEKNITIVRVPGSFELTYGCLSLLKQKKAHAIVALGCIIKGETSHDEYIAHAVAQGVVQLMVEYKKPISFGLLTVNTLEQATVRSTGENNKGKEAAIASLEMALL